MDIRPARIKDVRTIYQLILDATRRGKILKRPLSDIRSAIHHFWVVEDQGKVVACCAIEIYNKKLGEIRSLVVMHGYEGKGLATKLIKHCLQVAKEKKIYEVLAITDQISLFKKLHFAEQLHGQKPLFLKLRNLIR